jgi:hypothetical protein
MKTSLASRLRLSATISCLLVGLCSLSPAESAQKEQKNRVEDSDEYNVYSTVLKARYSGESVKRYVIALDTNSAAKNAFIGYRHGFAPSGAKRPEVDPETSRDFESKTKDACELVDKFTLPVPYSLVSEETLRKIFDNEKDGKPNEEGWHQFYKEYQGAPGAISFTRVGFNAKKDQALLYVAQQGDFLGGSGRFFVLSKLNNTWKIEKEVILWLS